MRSQPVLSESFQTSLSNKGKISSSFGWQGSYDRILKLCVTQLCMHKLVDELKKRTPETVAYSTSIATVAVLARPKYDLPGQS